MQIFVSAINAALHDKWKCSKCGNTQLVSKARLRRSVVCAVCGATIVPPKSKEEA